MSNFHGIEEGDTVYALDVLGRKACSEAPSMLFAERGDELIVLKVHPPTQYEKRFQFECRKVRGTGSFFVSARWITKMRHFEHNYSSYQKQWDWERVKEYRGD